MNLIQIHPTLLCDGSCGWCPYQGSHNDSEIPFAEIQRKLWHYQGSVWLSDGEKPSCKILKISGGGSPTLYSDFPKLLRFARSLGYTIYLQTENTPRLNSFVREHCHDIRVSFGDGIPFSPPEIPVDGFSYVISRSPEYDNLNKLIAYATKNRMYVRITQDDTDLDNIPTVEEIKAHLNIDLNTIPAKTTEGNRLTGLGQGGIRFWDALDYHHGKNPCPCYESPLLTPLGWFPCCKTHVAKGLTAGYNKTMNLGWEYSEIPYDGSGCSRCYY